jgi:hypothetical protein
MAIRFLTSLSPYRALRSKEDKKDFVSYSRHVGSITERIIGVLSDTHGQLSESVLRKLAPCELIIHAGDIGNVTVLDRLETLGKVIAVKGNVDHGPWSANLKEAEYVDFYGKTLLVIHNIDDLKLHPTSANLDVVIYGHSHRASKDYKNGVLYVNPGSAGPRRFTLPTSIAYLRLIDQRLIPEIILIEGNWASGLGNLHLSIL